MPIVRGDAEWPEAVHQKLGDYLEQALLGEELRVHPVASWMAGRFVHVVYRKRGWPGLYGLRRDTTRSVTGSEWEDPEVIAHEIAMYDLWEPHESAPTEFVERDEIYWRGDLTDGLPRTLVNV